MAGTSKAKKRDKFKKLHPEGRSAFAKEKKANKRVVNDFMEPEARKNLDLKKRKERSERKTKQVAEQEHKNKVLPPNLIY